MTFAIVATFKIVSALVALAVLSVIVLPLHIIGEVFKRL